MRGTKDGYRIKSVQITNDLRSSGARVSGSGTAAKIVGYGKATVLTLTLVLEHATKGEKTLSDAAFEIRKMPVPVDLSWREQRKLYSAAGEISNAELLSGLIGTTTGYRIKTVSISDAGGTGARVSRSGTGAKIVGYTKAGTLTLSIVFEHDTKRDKNITGGKFEITSIAAPRDLRWVRQSKAYVVSGEISNADLLRGLVGTKAGYRIKSVQITDASSSSGASVSGSGTAAKIIGYDRAVTLTLSIVFEHDTKADKTITGAVFEIRKMVAPRDLRWVRQSKAYRASGEISNFELLSGLGGAKDGYRIKSVQITRDSSRSGARKVGNGTAAKIVGYSKPTVLTLTLVFEHDAKADKTITAAFEIIKSSAPTLNWRRQSEVYSVRGELTNAELLGGVTGTKDGYRIRSVQITNDSSSSGARVSGSGTTAKIDSYTKATILTLTLVLEHDTKVDVTLTGKVYEIAKTRGETLTFSRREKSLIGGSFSTSEILAGVGGTKTGYTLKEIRGLNPGGVVTVNGTKPNLSLVMNRAGSFTATLVLEHDIKADATITGAAFKIKTTWSKLYGGSGRDIALSVVQTSDGGFAVGGYTTSKGLGYSDMWLLKLNALGNLTWDKTFGSSGADAIYSMLQMSDGSFALGGYTGHRNYGSLLKVSTSGNKIWEKHFGEIYTSLTRAPLVQTSDGGFAVAGAKIHSGSGGSRDFWVAKLDASGNKIWEKTFYPKLAMHDEATSIVQTSDGGFAVVGNTATSNDVWVLKLNATGDMIWNKTVGTSGSDKAKSIVQTSDGGFAIAGVSGEKGFVLKLNATGDKIWDKTLGNATLESKLMSVVQTSDGQLTVAGDIQSRTFAYRDYWILKLDISSGNKIWEKRHGIGPSGAADEGIQEELFSMVQTSDGGFVLCGFRRITSGNQDCWILKLDENGDL